MDNNPKPLFSAFLWTLGIPSKPTHTFTQVCRFFFPFRCFAINDFLGYTPLFVAISGRQWSTAKLIIAIATAQYHPDEEDNVDYSENIQFG